MIRRGPGATVTVTNAGIAQTLPEDAGKVGLLVLSLNLGENFLGTPGCGSESN